MEIKRYHVKENFARSGGQFPSLGIAFRKKEGKNLISGGAGGSNQ